jgi:uncharacterized protein YndB with AHSA1/START domain
MKTQGRTNIMVTAAINAPVAMVWSFWTDPIHIVHWNNASSDWHTTFSENDLRVNGKFLSRMEARDGSMGFDFDGVYQKVETMKLIEYTLSDGRNVEVSFLQEGGKTKVTENFEAEQINPVEMQKAGWQAILNNFKDYVEKYGKKKTLHFEITINKSAEIVFNTMLNEKTYAEWTSEFNPTSHFQGSWKKGSKIVFIGADSDGNTGGMVSRIKENLPNRYLSIEHLGIIKDGKEITTGKEVEDWAGALEIYTFTAQNGKTRLAVDIDSNEEFGSYFNETWPKALKKLKIISEE